MPSLKFSRLSLCSINERSALQLDFAKDSNVLIGGNGFGKSAILKSLYDALGGKPHKIDDSWKGARVSTLLEFSVDSRDFAVLKSDKSYTVFDAKKNVLLDTTHVTKELGPFLARLLNFKLQMADRNDQVITPPPSYIFAPFYIDQDSSWSGAWRSFADLFLPNSPKSLAEYHSGLKPNDYYAARAERDVLAAELRTVDAERKVIDNTLARIRDTLAAIPVDFDIAVFEAETSRLIRESQGLHNEQSRYRKKLGDLNEELRLWRDQEEILRAALAEMNAELHAAAHMHTSVECPMCGQHYDNKIADQFELVEDQDNLGDALRLARRHISDLDVAISEYKPKIQKIEASIGRVQDALAAHKADISLDDVVKAQGKSEASRILNAQLDEYDANCGRLARAVADAKAKMDQLTSADRTKQINAFFAERLRANARALDVRLNKTGAIGIRAADVARGSEGPRGLVAFYFAFLETERQHGSSAFCPIVVDAPNQQGQDAGHVKAIMNFILTSAPEQSQLIVAAETMPIEAEATLIDISSEKNRVLRQDLYDHVSDYLRPYQQAQF